VSPEPRRLSVVVPSVNGWPILRECLEALAVAGREEPLEVLVADRLGEPLRAEVRRHFPEVRVLGAPPSTSIPALRAMGFEAAGAEAVAVIEDHVLVPPDWARSLLAALANGAEVVGGAVENAATETIVDWAAFLCEYSQLLPPLVAGPVASLTGNNTAYRRELLLRYRRVWQGEGWENTLHEAMRGEGVVLTQCPEIVVGHRMHYTVGLYLAQRYLYARSFAGRRLAGAPLWRHVFFGLAALLLPPVLLARVGRTVWSKGRYRKELTRSLPLLALFVTAWGAGEVVGYWFGPGDALSRVR
jgi:glycosyl transferase family 2